MKTAVAQHYRNYLQVHVVCSTDGLQSDKWASTIGASTFARSHEISMRTNATDVNSDLQNPLRGRVVRPGLRAVGVGGHTYIGQMTAGSEMDAAAHLTWITNVVNQIEATEGTVW